MSNRDIILDLILKYFPDYQIIILTHDRAFFEMAKQKFNFKAPKEWKYFEMYVDKYCENNIEYPFIKEYREKYSYINKAKEHFKNKDYPACLNYLRKEVEKQFDKYLELDNLNKKIELSQLKEDYSNIKEIIEDLKKIYKILKKFEHCEKMTENIRSKNCQKFAEQVMNSIKSFDEYFEKFHINYEFNIFNVFLKNILHPQSHNDFTKPLYKKELEEAIKVIEKLRASIEN